MRTITGNKFVKITISYLWIVVVAGTLNGCNIVSRLSEVGDGPKLTNIQNPVAKPDYKPVSLPMPTPHVAEANPNSQTPSGGAGGRGLAKDGKGSVGG